MKFSPSLLNQLEVYEFFLLYGQNLKLPLLYCLFATQPLPNVALIDFPKLDNGALCQKLHVDMFCDFFYLISGLMFYLIASWEIA